LKTIMYETFNTIFDRLVLSKVSIHDGYYTVKKKEPQNAPL